MAVSIGTPTTAGLANGSNSTTFSFVSTTDPLYVRVTGFFSGSPTACTYNSVSLTKIAESGLSSGTDDCQIWRLTSPTSGTHNVVLTHTSTVAAGVISAANVTGQDTTTPEGTPATAVSASNGTATGSVSITGAVTGDVTIVGVAVGTGQAVTPSASGGGAAAEEYDINSNNEEGDGFKAADTTTSVSASWSTSASWGLAAIPLKAPSGLPPGLGPDLHMQPDMTMALGW